MNWVLRSLSLGSCLLITTFCWLEKERNLLPSISYLAHLSTLDLLKSRERIFVKKSACLLSSSVMLFSERCKTCSISAYCQGSVKWGIDLPDLPAIETSIAAVVSVPSPAFFASTQRTSPSPSLPSAAIRCVDASYRWISLASFFCSLAMLTRRAFQGCPLGCYRGHSSTPRFHTAYSESSASIYWLFC